MDETWQHIAQQIRELPAYIALLRNHEVLYLKESLLFFPSMRLTLSLDSHTQGSNDHANAQDTAAIINLLLQMIESKWSFGAVSPDHQRLLDYAHDWASETLLALVAPSDDHQSTTSTSSEALELMGRELFVYRTETESDRLREIERSIEDVLASSGANLAASDIVDVLEACADHIHDDQRFVDVVESVMMTKSGRSRDLSAMGASFKARILNTERGGRRLLDSLSFQTRLRVWESDLELWTEQLDQWLLCVHAQSLASVSAIVGFPASRSRTPSSPLYVALIAWTSQSHRRKWLCGSRSRELVSALSRLLRDDEHDSEAFSRRVLAKVPRAWSLTPSHRWPLKQRAFVLRSVAQGLLTAATDDRSQWLEFIGLIERIEIAQHALDALVTASATEDTTETERAHAVQVFAWFEGFVYGIRGANGMETLVTEAIQELSEAIARLSVSRDGDQWLLEQRSSTFSTLTVTKLRITWRWLLKEVYSGSNQPRIEDVREVLESIEYIIRRHAPASESRSFQVEIIALFLNDLEWIGAQYAGADAKNESTGIVKTWLVKLVRLLPQEATEVDPTTNLSKQLDHRLSAIGF